MTGGVFGLHEGQLRSLPTLPAARTLGAKHAANSDNLSRYLLEQLGIDGARLRVNQDNKTRELSVRDVARLSVIDETKMQSKIAPPLSGRPIDRTVEVSALKFLLDGTDDSALIAVPSKKDRRQIANAKVEVIDALILRLRNKLADVGDEDAVRNQLARLNSALRGQYSAISDLADQRRQVADRLARHGRAAADNRQRSAEIEVLESRFSLLLDKYESDLARLEMVGEAGTLLGLFTPGICVFCGADPDHQRHGDHVPQDSTSFAEAVTAERRKTELLAGELRNTLADLNSERQSKLAIADQIEDAIAQLRLRVRRLDDAITPQQADLSDLTAQRSKLDGFLSDYAEIAALEEMKDSVEAENAAEKAQAATSLDLKTINRFSEAIADRLAAWNVPDSDRVRYDRNEQDLIAGDQLRSAHGKGVRAILHAAFTMGLAQYCFENDRPHPGFVVLDSPLVTYRPPDEGESDDLEKLDIGVAARFYADIQASFDGQIIVMENMDPPEGLEPNSADVRFTKSVSSGRYGFFPV
ncbi:hypothetical protein ACAG24_024855 [Mycobacterium sp. pW049]|uniref:hypothetical protein n=1 Tax=[Mycobacterium] bulgaricum TaxID=3238985 RepID=UPI00351BD666